MKPSYFSFRWHKLKRHFSARIHNIRLWLHNYIQRHVYGAWQKLGLMRWQFAAWILIASVSAIGIAINLRQLDKFWLHEVPQAGGIYREAIIGRARQVNPLYIDNTATADVAELVFSKLIRMPAGDTNGLPEADLAESWTISADKRTYTFRLRNGVKWHDGTVFNSKDVAFTFRTIQSPDARSNLAASWDKVVVNAVDDQTVQFVLPASYSGFLSALGQVGILPEHSLSSIRPAQLRLDDFNRQPNGTGPFRLERLDANSEVITLRRNPEYFGGRPLLDSIELIQFDDEASALDAYAKQRVDGLSSVAAGQRATVAKFSGLTVQTFRLPVYVGAFYNNSRPGLIDPAVRQALGAAIDRSALVREALDDQGNVVHYPLPAGYPGYNAQALRVGYNPAAAKAKLQNVFTQRLKLVTANTGQYPEIARRLSQQWREAGVPVDVIELDAFSLQQNYIRPRQYDILLYGQDLGPDSDVYSFWHSSQVADPGLNLSAYKNAKADQLIEQARFGKDPSYRDQKYREWVALWAADTPATLLYTPYYLYAHSVDLTGVSTTSITTPSGRLQHAERWAIRSVQAPYKQK